MGWRIRYLGARHSTRKVALMFDDRGSDPLLPDVPDALFLLGFFLVWAVATWYWWTRTRVGIIRDLESKSPDKARTWREVSMILGVVWTGGFLVSFVSLFAELLR